MLVSVSFESPDLTVVNVLKLLNNLHSDLTYLYIFCNFLMIKAQIMSKPIKSRAVYGQKALSKEGPEIALSLSFRNFPFTTRSSLFDKVNEIIAKIEQGFRTGRDIVKDLNIRHQRVLSHLTEAAYKRKLDTEMPHELTQNN